MPSWTRLTAMVLANLAGCGPELVGTEGFGDGDGGGSEDIGPSVCRSAGVGCWSDRFGTPEAESVAGVAVDGSRNVYVVGSTTGRFDGGEATIYQDVFVSKHCASGTRAWTLQFGNELGDHARAVAINREDHLVVVGIFGGYEGGPSEGEANAFALELTSDGDVVRDFVPSWIDRTEATDVAIGEEGAIHITGFFGNIGAYDVFVAKYHASGALAWFTVLDTLLDDAASSLAIDATGNTYVVGSTKGAWPGHYSAGGSDLFVVKLDVDGDVAWIRQLGGSGDEGAADVAASHDGVYVAGGTSLVGEDFDGNPSSGRSDAYLMKLDSRGDRQWIAYIGTTGADVGGNILMGTDDTITVVGTMEGTLTSEGVPFIATFDASGQRTGLRTPDSVADVFVSRATMTDDRILVVGGVGVHPRDVGITWVCD